MYELNNKLGVIPTTHELGLLFLILDADFRQLADWALDLTTYPMSVMIACGGLSAATFLISILVQRVRVRGFLLG
jgi:hypothetical protein